MTVVEAFADAWLLIEHSPSGAELVGLAEDYDAARVWLLQGADAVVAGLDELTPERLERLYAEISRR